MQQSDLLQLISEIQALDQKLADVADLDTLLKIKAVEQTLQFNKENKLPNVNEFHSIYQKIYQFYNVRN